MKIIKSPKRMEKKAVIEVQFNWVFVLIAGTMILMFFIIIVNKQKSVSDKKLAVNILNSMDRVLSGQKTSENRQDVIDMFEAEMSYSCGGCDCTFSLAGMSKSKGNLVVFAPTSMKSDRLLTWTQGWDMPFRVSNFVYMTTPEIKYYLVGPSLSVRRDFVDGLPVNVSYDVVADINSIAYKGEQKVRLVFFSDANPPQMPSGLADAGDSIVTALVIDGTAGAWYNGRAKLKFYKKKGPVFVPDNDEDETTNEYPALGMQTAYGAIYSDSFQNFRCNMDDAVKKMGYVARIYKERAGQLSQKAVDGEIYSGCNAFYATTYFNGFGSKDTSSLYDSINLLTTFNEGAVISSCPRIY